MNPSGKPDLSQIARAIAEACNRLGITDEKVQEEMVLAAIRYHYGD